MNPTLQEDWIISSNEEFRIRKRLEAVGTPLKNWDISIYRGVLTGLNEAFIIDGRKRAELIARDPRSAEIIKPILRGRDIKRYKAEHSDLWLIASHNGYRTPTGGRIPAIDVRQNYPVVWEHLQSINQETGGKAEKRCDQGAHWSNLRDCAYFEEFEKEKIVYADIMRLTKGEGRFPRFAFVKAEQYFSNTVFMVSGKPVKYLIAILNSSIGKYLIETYVNRFDETGFRMFTIFIEKLPIPYIKEQLQLPFEILVDGVLFAKEKGMEREAELIETVIDGLVYDLYFEEEMRAAHCFVTERLTEVLQPFKPEDTDEFKTEYILELCRFFEKDETVRHALVHRSTVPAVRIVTGEKS